MRRIILTGILANILLLSFLVPMPARADIAPPDQPPGANPEPGKEPTQVRMEAEKVLIEVLPTTPEGSLGQANVTATFTMRNLGSQSEKLPVRFPLGFTGWDTGDLDHREIQNLRVKVNRTSYPTRRVTSQSDDNRSNAWAEFDVTFPPDQVVTVVVDYLLEGAGEYPYIAFKYVLVTGEGWKGTIGQAEIILRFTYEANPQNVIFDTQIGWSQTSPGGVISGKEVRWQYQDFEPAQTGNFTVSIVMPSTWRTILREQDNLSKNPKDGEAWGRVGKLYKEIFFLRRGFREDAGGLELYRMSQEAYQQAVTLLPNDATWLAGYAELFWIHYYYSEYFRQNPNHQEMLQALQLLKHSLEIDPQNAKAQEVLYDMYYASGAVKEAGGQFTFLWLTATPTWKPTETFTPSPPTVTTTSQPTASPTRTPVPSQTLAPPPPATETPEQHVTQTLPTASTPAASTPRSRLPICGTAALLPLLVILGIGLSWRNRSFPA